jgi:hypothetical protein
MKLKQNEFCHNCNQYVDFEFEDILEKQIILCPKCGHEHYREMDESTLFKIRMIKYKPIEVCFYTEGDIPREPNFEIEERGQARLTDRRWGQDPKQKG